MTEQGFRKVFLAVSGMSPQIITETLYALIQDKGWIPDEVRLITTEQGRQNAVLQLLEGEKYFERLLADYQINQPVQFNQQSITVIKDANGHALADLRSPKDNEAAADTICAEIRELTSDPGIELHVSLAGGRKTMGFYAGYALSLFGRPQDCLSHILVSEHYESHQNFFYPTQYTHVIHTHDGRVLDTSAARVWLAEIPFVRIRNRLPEPLLQGTHSFSETVQLAREATEIVQLVLFPASKRYSVNGRVGVLSPVNMGLLLWMAVRAADQQPAVEPVVEGEQRSAAEFLAIAEQHWLSLHAKTEQGLLKDGITQKWLEQNVSKLNHVLADRLGPELAERCKLASRSVRGSRGYALPDDLVLRIESELSPTRPRPDMQNHVKKLCKND